MKNLRLPPMEASPSLDWNTFFELVSSVLLTSGTPAGLFYYYRPRAEWWELLGVGFLGLLASYLLGYFANRRGSWLSLPRSWSKEVADHGDEGSLVLLGMMALWNLIVGLSTGMYRCLAKMQAQASPERRTQLLQTILALLAEGLGRRTGSQAVVLKERSGPVLAFFESAWPGV